MKYTDMDSFIHFDEKDEDLSWIEKELEQKLWDIFDRTKNKKFVN